MRGGESADRVAGFWRALGLAAPAEPDHLTTLLHLYAYLGEAASEVRRPQTRDSLERMSQVLLWEHLWSWIPGYLEAVADLGLPALSGWAHLLFEVVGTELLDCTPDIGGSLPAALRDAPPALAPTDDLDELVDGLVAPVCSGMVLTGARLAAASRHLGLGRRVGGRRFSLHSMIEQDGVEVLGWLVTEAQRWRDRRVFRAPPPFDIATRWWTERAGRTTITLTQVNQRRASPQPENASIRAHP
jgi:hypothetical protein